MPHAYFAPMGGDTRYHRFGDIWMGVNLKRVLDDKGWAMVHGVSEVIHHRASDVFNNLAREAAGIRQHEALCAFPEDDRFDFKYWSMFQRKRELWQKLTSKMI